MKRIMGWTLGLVILLGLMASAAPQDPAQSPAKPAAGGEQKAGVSGKWSGTLDVKREDGSTKAEPAYLILRQEAATLSGSAGPHEGEQLSLKNGQVEGDRVTFEITMGNDRTVAFDLKVKGDQLEGDLSGPSKDGTRRMARLSVKRVADK